MRKDALWNITTSGALISSDFLDSLRQVDNSNPRVRPETFVSLDGSVPSRKEMDARMVDEWKRLCQQWDEVSFRIKRMDVSEARRRWIIPLLHGLGYEPVYLSQDVVPGKDERLKFHLSHKGWHESRTTGVPVPFVHTVAPGDDLDTRPPKGGRNAKSPHGTLQLFLNTSKRHTWALLTNGLVLRVMRDFYHTYTKGYVEFDLENIFRERSYSDFRALYRIAHTSRFFPGDEGVCPLEFFYQQSLAAGIKVGDDLRKNVRKSIETLANSFLDQATAEKLVEDEELCREYYREILQVVYRIIFLLFAEQRGMLPSRDSLYAEEYSITRLRERTERPIVRDRHHDLWEGLQATFRLLKEGCQPLKVHGYNGSLFYDGDLKFLSGLECKNSELLKAVRYLTHIERDKVLQRISYVDLGVEEIGSIYESLLDYNPRVLARPEEIDGDKYVAHTFVLDPRGAARKTTGSYYTHPKLVDELIKSALKPVLEDRLETARKEGKDLEKALLDIKVCDPACGSAAFLTASTNFLGHELAKIRTGMDYPEDTAEREARREVLQHCIYGVDLNPMAVELAKVSLWINACVPDKPLNFLDHHIKCGNSLIGTTPELIKQGILEDAFNPVTGDDKKAAKEVKKTNRQQLKNIALATFHEEKTSLDEPTEFANLANAAEDDAAGVEKKREDFERIKHSEKHQRRKLVADTWTASFFWPLKRDAPLPPTQQILTQIQREGGQNSEKNTIGMIETLAHEYNFFHWYLEFPDVFNKNDPGFDCVIGNPPWEIVELNEDEFFSVYIGFDELGKTKRKKKEQYNKILQNDEILTLYSHEKNKIDKFNNYVKTNAHYQKVDRKKGFPPKNNTYRLFIESFYNISNNQAYCGMITPLGIQGDEGCISIKRDLLIPNTKFSTIYGFNENNDYFNVNQAFAVFSFAKGKTTDEILFYQNLHNFEDVKLKTNIPISVDLINKISSELLLYEISSTRELSIIKKLYSHPKLQDIIDNNEINIQFGSEEINETRGSPYFSEESCQTPLIKGDGVKPYVKPIISRFIETNFFNSKSKNNYANNYRLIWGDVRNKNMSKRMCFTLSEPNCAIGNSVNYIIQKENNVDILAYLACIFNSFIIEYCFRKISSNNHVNKRTVKELPVNISGINSKRLSYIIKIFNEIYQKNEENNSDNIAKINALVALIYDINIEELEYILDSYSVLKGMEMSCYHEFRTKKLILEYFDVFIKERTYNENLDLEVTE